MGQRTPKTKARTYADNYIEFPNRDRDLVPIGQGEIQKILFRFQSPAADSIFTDSCRYDNRANRSFMARLYWNGTPTGQIVLIFNGLDETLYSGPSDPFEFYDQLGESLAYKDFLAILLPTPYHLNRVLAFTEDEARRRNGGDLSRPDYTKPSLALMRHHSSIYKNHFQGFKETLGLVRELLPKVQPGAFRDVPRVSCVSPKVGEFLRACVEEPARVSLIGYSLGGLRALTEYFRDRYEAIRTAKRRPLFSCCVAINSGGALNTLPNPDWVEKDQWAHMIDELLCQRLEGNEERFDGFANEKEAASRHYAFLDDIFLGQAISLNTLSKTDNQVSRRVLFILGGDDQLVPPPSLTRLAPTGGLNIFQIAGMGHMLSYDESWKHWRPVVFDVIKQFLRTVVKRSASVHGLTEMVVLLDHRLGLFPYYLDSSQSEVIDDALEQVREKLPEGTVVKVLGNKESKDLESRFGSSASVETVFRDYCESLLQRLRHFALLGRGGDLRIYRKIRRKYLLGAYLTDSNRELQDAWEMLVAEYPGKRLGDILTDLKVVTKSALDRALDRQARDIAVLQRRMAADIVQSQRNKRADMSP